MDSITISYTKNTRRRIVSIFRSRQTDSSELYDNYWYSVTHQNVTKASAHRLSEWVNDFNLLRVNPTYGWRLRGFMVLPDGFWLDFRKG